MCVCKDCNTHKKNVVLLVFHLFALIRANIFNHFDELHYTSSNTKKNLFFFLLFFVLVFFFFTFPYFYHFLYYYQNVSSSLVPATNNSYSIHFRPLFLSRVPRLSTTRVRYHSHLPISNHFVSRTDSHQLPSSTGHFYPFFKCFLLTHY